jgi:histone deacetylase complex subunit SAP30
MVEHSQKEATMRLMEQTSGGHSGVSEARGAVNAGSASSGLSVTNTYMATGNAQICCLIDEASRCNRLAGNASCSKRIQRTMMQRKLRLTIDESAGHIYICDHHKNIIQSMRSISKRKRKDEEEDANSNDEYSFHNTSAANQSLNCSNYDYDDAASSVDLSSLQVNTLRRYKRYYRVSTKPGLNKSQLAEVRPS